MTPELSSWYLGAFTSVVAAYALPVATAGLSAGRRWVRARAVTKSARAARSAADEEAATLDVGDTILHGRVEYADGEHRAVTVSVEQFGTEAESSGSWTVTWTETRRTTEVAPFYVVHASGARVRVEPGAETKLIGALSGRIERKDTSHRTRLATVAPDQEVWVTGLLGKDNDPQHIGGGYRDSHASWVMRPPPVGWASEPMSVSTQPPEARLVKQAARARVWMVVFTLLFAAMMLSHTQYHALLWSGQATTAQVTGTHTNTDSDGDTSAYVLEVQVEGPEPFSDTWQVTSNEYTHYQAQLQMRETPSRGNHEMVPLTVPTLASFGAVQTSMPGSTPLALGAPSLITTLVWLVLALIARSNERAKEWYDGTPVVDSAGGRLADNP